MTADADREPVIVGWAQLSDHGNGESEPMPDAMLASVARSALERSGAGDALLAELGTIAIVESTSWPVPDPGRLLATAIGAGAAGDGSGVETVRSRTSGCSPIELLADSCGRISAGELEVALIGGAECFDVLLRSIKAGVDPGFAVQPEGTEPDRIVGAETTPSHPVEIAAGLIVPVAYYPMFESVLRSAAGRSPDQHRIYLGRLWARFAAVAAENPHAWNREAPDAERIATAAADNRQVSIPYTKRMNSNIQTNQAAALVVCSRAAAERAGIPVTAQVAVRATATGSDHNFVASRPELGRSPALAACAGAALGHAGLEIAAIEHLDIYSCFPSAVQVAAGELGLDPLEGELSPTVTGGLSFAGGPGSNYVTHSLAAVSERVAGSGGNGLATAVGWYLTKHGIAILAPAAEPGPGYAHFSPQAEIDAGPQLEIVAPPDSGTATVEAYTAICDRSGDAELGIATFLVAGGRTVAKADDPDSLRALAERDCVGAEATFGGEGRFRLA